MARNSGMGTGRLIDPETSANYFTKPGLHGHNVSRRVTSPSPIPALRYLRIVLLIMGFFGIAYYGYAVTNQYVYQAYQNWAFDQQIAGRAHASFADYVREETPFAFLVGGKAATVVAPIINPSLAAAAPKEIPHIPPGASIGRVSIGRLNITAMVREGVDADTLSKAVGHVPTTGFPGQPGNFAIAAHRDTLFRGLKDIQKDDLVTFQSQAGTYTYQVLATKIVQPSDVSVLQPDGGGLIHQAAAKKEGDSLLTMITCYPFYYLGSAPKRFIVEGKLVATDAKSVLPLTESATEASSASPPSNPPKRVTRAPARTRIVKQASLKEPHHMGGSSRFRRSTRSTEAPRATGSQAENRPKKRGFWHKLFHGD